MAKIYETLEDLERERLSREAQEQKNLGSTNFSLGLADTALGITNLHLGSLNNSQLQSVGRKPGVLDHLYKPLGWAILALGAVNIALSYRASGKAKEAEAELEKLGPEQVVLQEAVQPGETIQVPGGSITMRDVQQNSCGCGLAKH